MLRGNAVLVGRRRRAPLAGYWEFPGGKIRVGETADRACLREVREEAGVEADLVDLLVRRRWTYPHGVLDLHFFLCRASAAGAARPRHPFRWVPRAALHGLRFPPANAPALSELVSARSTPSR